MRRFAVGERRTRLAIRHHLAPTARASDPVEAGFVLPDDVEPAPPVGAWVALLPGLDATVMGWSGRGWFLGQHGPFLFDRNGNAGPTAWCNGRVTPRFRTPLEQALGGGPSPRTG